MRRAPVPAVAVEGHEPERSGWRMMGPVTLSDEEIGRMEGRGQDGQHMRRSARLGGASGAHAPAPVRAPSVALTPAAGLGATRAPQRAALGSSMNNVSQIDSVLAKRQKRAASKGTRAHTTHACNACRDADKARSCSLGLTFPYNIRDASAQTTTDDERDALRLAAETLERLAVMG